METKKDRQHILARTGKRWSSFFHGHPVASALQIAKIPLECIPGLKEGGVGKGEQGLGLCYPCFGTLCFFFFFPSPTKIYFFLSASNVKLISWALWGMCPPLRYVWQGGGLCQGALRAGVFMCACLSVCVRVCVYMGEWGKEKGHGKAKREMRGGGGGFSTVCINWFSLKS